jgi:VWFA-related protein
MKKFVKISEAYAFGLSALLGLTLLLVLPSLGQTPTASPPEVGEVVKISTNLIQLDVSVTDRNGNPITDLRADEIEIYENGQRQKIAGFSFVSSTRERTAAAAPTAVPGVPVPPVRLRPEQVRRTIALVVDDLSLSHETTYLTRRALTKFVDEQMQEGDLVAIIRSGAGVGALQQFTSDKRILHTAIQRVKWNPMGTGGVSAFSPIEPNPAAVQSAAGDTSVTAADIEEETNRLNAFDDFRGSVFAAGTLGSLQFILRGMAGYPGRKSVVMFSEGFRLFQRDRDGTPRTGKVMDFMRELVDQANRASVVFYTIDPRGLMYTGLTAADNTRGMSPAAMRAAMRSRGDDLFETQGGLNYLAQETGGFAFFNQNDLNRGVARILQDQSYYLLAYEPDPETFDAANRRYNRVEIKVLRQGAEVRYRSGFFNQPGPANVAAQVNLAASPREKLIAALYSPFAVTDIELRLNALFGNDGATGSYVRSLLHVDGRGLRFTDEPDGSKKAEFEVLATSFGDLGQLSDQIGKTYTLTVPPDIYKKIVSDGFVYHFTFPVKKAGAYQLRVAIRDTQSGMLGSTNQFIDIPDLTKRSLTPSGIILESLSVGDYQRLISADAAAPPAGDSITDTAVRRIKPGTVLRYGMEVYNAGTGTLLSRVRMFREGQLVFDSGEKPVDRSGSGSGTLTIRGAVAIGTQMEPGDHILQIIVTETHQKGKPRSAMQFVDFELVP